MVKMSYGKNVRKKVLLFLRKSILNLREKPFADYSRLML